MKTANLLTFFMEEKTMKTNNNLLHESVTSSVSVSFIASILLILALSLPSTALAGSKSVEISKEKTLCREIDGKPFAVKSVRADKVAKAPLRVMDGVIIYVTVSEDYSLGTTSDRIMLQRINRPAIKRVGRPVLGRIE